MTRSLLALACLGFVIAGPGCSMCAHPYDECYPTFQGGCDGEACQGPRAGSIRAMGLPHAGVPSEAVPDMEQYYQEQSAARPRAGTPTGRTARVAPPPAAPVPQRIVAAPYGQPGQRAVMPHVAAQRNARNNYQVSPDVWQAIPAADRATAKVLSVTDRRADETDPAAGGYPVAGSPATSQAPGATPATPTVQPSRYATETPPNPLR